jgi:hypothetical protein
MAYGSAMMVSLIEVEFARLDKVDYCTIDF